MSIYTLDAILSDKSISKMYLKDKKSKLEMFLRVGRKISKYLKELNKCEVKKR